MSKKKSGDMKPVTPALAPVNAAGSLVPASAPIEKPSAPRDLDAVLDEYVEANPAMEAPAAEAPAVEAEAPAATEENATETPVVQGEAKLAETPVNTDVKAEDKPIEKPSAEAVMVEPYVEAKPVEAAKPEPAKPIAVEPTTVFEFEPGKPWTGEQVVLALRERAEALPLADEAKLLRQTFGYGTGAEIFKPGSPFSTAWRRARKMPSTFKST